jgi:AcrR family transcriptional regulator
VSTLPNPRSSRKLRAAYHHGDLKRALLEAAFQLLEEKGVAALSLREAARLTGVTHQAPYRHFTDKTELVAAVAEEGFRTLHEGMATVFAAHLDDPSERINALGVSYVKFAVAHPALFRLMFGEEIADKSAFPSLRAAADGLMATLTTTIAEAQRAKKIRPGDPLDMAVAGWAMMHGLASLLIEGPLARYPQGKQLPEDVAKMAVQMLRAGMDTPATGA